MYIFNCLESEYSTIGEFGIVYKAQLIHWLGEGLPKAVAVKTLKGTISGNYTCKCARYAGITRAFLEVYTL